MSSVLKGETIADAIYQRYLAALLVGDSSQCALILHDLVAAGVGLKDLYVRLFQRSLYEVGELWEGNRISIAVEHLATAITERMLALVQAQVFSGTARKRSIVIACVTGEYHQIGARIVADYCELLGWRGHFLGANTPLPALLQLIEERRPDMVALSVTLRANLPAVFSAVHAIAGARPALPILVGGQGFHCDDLDGAQLNANVSGIGTLAELEQQLLTHER
jgi:methanogenic corrinoid protein MtbC1